MQKLPAHMKFVVRECFVKRYGNGRMRLTLVRFRSSIVSRVIPSPGCDAQGSGAVESLDTNRVVNARRVRIRGAIADYVLIPDVARNRTRDGFHLVETG